MRRQKRRATSGHRVSLKCARLSAGPFAGMFVVDKPSSREEGGFTRILSRPPLDGPNEQTSNQCVSRDPRGVVVVTVFLTLQTAHSPKKSLRYLDRLVEPNRQKLFIKRRTECPGRLFLCEVLRHAVMICSCLHRNRVVWYGNFVGRTPHHRCAHSRTRTSALSTVGVGCFVFCTFKFLA